MIDFYEALKLQRSWGLDEINKSLVQHEATWKKREITNPEKARKMLVIVDEAKAAFKTSATRSKYDRDLEESKREPVKADPNAERNQQFDKWYSDARQFRSSNQNDLAKTAIEKAITFSNPNFDDPDFFSLAAEIYRENKDYSTALNYINKAIVASPDVPMQYINKAFIIERQALAAQGRSSHSEATELFGRERETIQMAISKAENSGDDFSRAAALGMLAYSWYFFSNPDKGKAEQLALQAIGLGDPWSSGQIVIDDINAKRTAAEEAAKKEKERQQRLAKEEQERQQKFERETRENKERQDRILRRKRTTSALYGISWVIFVLCAVYVFYSIYSEKMMGMNIDFYSALLFISIAFLNFADIFRDGYGTGSPLFVGGITGFAYSFGACTYKYRQMGFSAAKTWKIVGIMILILAVSIFVSGRVGKALAKSQRA